MDFLDKLERKIGKYAIKNLSLFLILGYVIGYFLYYTNQEVYNMLTLDPYYIFKGQIWRIITWVITIPDESNIIIAAIMMFFYYSIGNALEKTWGAFRYNVYIFSGIIFTLVAALLIYLFVPASVILGDYAYVLDLYNEASNELSGYFISQYISTYYINLSIFLAFAASYPDMQVLLYFIIPIKIKWLAYLDVALLAFSFIFSGLPVKIAIIASMLNFILFFFTSKNMRHISPKNIRRKAKYKKDVYTARNMYEGGARHKCAICGRTEKDYPELSFRYCSKCGGNREYCQDHLFTHQHVQ
jgi:hypothetical protein